MRQVSKFMHRHDPILLSALFLLAACGGEGDPGGFEPPHEVDGPEAARIPWEIGTKERFDIRPMGASGNSGMAAHNESTMRLAYDLPKGWTEMPLSLMRAANFRVAGDERAECYLTLLGGDSGGLEANVNRWRSQISLEAMSDGEIGALPRADLLGGMATFVDFSGTWKGMSGTESNEGWRLMGLLLVSPQGSAFLKMTGPDAALAGEKENFLALAKSLHVETGEAEHDGHNHEKEVTDAIAPPAAMPGMDSTPVAMGEHDGLSWSVPAAWKNGPEKSMRAANLIPADGVECYLAVLVGEGGGALANANRWRQQLGRDDLSKVDFDGLPRWKVLGTDAPMIEIDGEGDSTGQTMLGVMAFANGRSIFVKMTGPSETVKKERENFRAFAESVKEKP